MAARKIKNSQGHLARVFACLIGRDTGEGHVDDVTLGVERESLDEGSLSRPGRAVKQQPQLVRISTDRVLAFSNARRNRKRNGVRAAEIHTRRGDGGGEEGCEIVYKAGKYSHTWPCFCATWASFAMASTHKQRNLEFTGQIKVKEGSVSCVTRAVTVEITNEQMWELWRCADSKP